MTVVRNDEGTDIPGTANDLRLIARFTPGGTVEVYEASWPKRSTRNAGGHGPGTREHVFVTRGGLKVGPLGREVGLAGGDYATFAADEPHLYEARAGTRALLLMQWAPGARPHARPRPARSAARRQQRHEHALDVLGAAAQADRARRIPREAVAAADAARQQPDGDEVRQLDQRPDLQRHRRAQHDLDADLARRRRHEQVARAQHVRHVGLEVAQVAGMSASRRPKSRPTMR